MKVLKANAISTNPFVNNGGGTQTQGSQDTSGSFWGTSGSHLGSCRGNRMQRESFVKKQCTPPVIITIPPGAHSRAREGAPFNLPWQGRAREGESLTHHHP